MHPIKIYIPVSSNNPELSLGVADAIRAQSLPCDYEVCATPGEYNSHRNYTDLRCFGIAASRNLCRLKALLSGAEFCGMLDKDMVCGPDVFKNMFDLIQTDNTIGMVGCKGICGTPDILDMGVSLWRVSALPVFTLAKNTCMCEIVNKAVWKLGYKTIFLNNQQVMEV